MEVSSTTRRSQSSGLSSFLRKPPVLGLISRSRWICLVSCRLGHAFGRASGRCAQEEADFFRGENAQDRIHQGGLADTWAAGDHHYFRSHARRSPSSGCRQAPGQCALPPTGWPSRHRWISRVAIHARECAADRRSSARRDRGRRGRRSRALRPDRDHLPGIELKPQGVEDDRVRDFQELDREWQQYRRAASRNGLRQELRSGQTRSRRARIIAVLRCPVSSRGHRPS